MAIGDTFVSGFQAGNEMRQASLKRKFEAEQLQKQLDAEAAVLASTAANLNATANRTTSLTPSEKAELDARAGNIAASTDNTRANTARTRTLTPKEATELDARAGNIAASTARTNALTPEEVAGERARTAATIAGATKTMQLLPAEQAQLEAQAAALAAKGEGGRDITEFDPTTNEPISRKVITPFSDTTAPGAKPGPAAPTYPTPDAVRGAFQAKKITRDQASQILRTQFGMK